MATDRLPWLKFNTTDWRGDAKLRACSAAAQGVWINMLALMHESTPYGHLPVNPSDNPMVNRPLLALQLGMRESDVVDGIAELERHGVLSRTDEGVIFSRRMVRDAERAEKNALNGKRGGNPKLAQSDSVKPSVKPMDNPSVKPSDKPAGARARSGLSSTSSKDKDELVAARFETFWDAYPRREAKKDAFVAFTRIDMTPEVLAEILDAVRRFKLTEQWQNPKYIPLPATWLNKERWKDQVIVTPVEPKPNAPFVRMPPVYPNWKDQMAKDAAIALARDAEFLAKEQAEAAAKAGVQ